MKQFKDEIRGLVLYSNEKSEHYSNLDVTIAGLDRLLISERPKIPYVHDIGAACGSACVWLDPRNSSERKILDNMLADMTPGRDIVLGWYPEERSGVGEATKYGLSTVPADFFENATVYTAVSKPVVIPPSVHVILCRSWMTPRK